MGELQKVRIAYVGEALENGSMDLNYLAPALMAFGEFVMRVNEVIGSKQQVRVMLSADGLRKGSFDVSLELLYSGLDQMKALVGFADDSGIKALMEVLGWGVTGTAVITSIWKLVNTIAGRKIKSVEQGGAGVIIRLDDDKVIQTTANTFNVYMDMHVRENMYKIVAPLAKDGIERFELRDPINYDNSQYIEAVSKDNMGLYDIAGLEVQVEPELVQELEMRLKIVGIVFDEKQKWRFSDGDVTFWAKIEDDEFWQKIESGELAFRKGDRLRVHCRIVQKSDALGNFSAERTITKVIEIIPKPTQIKLDLFG